MVLEVEKVTGDDMMEWQGAWVIGDFPRRGEKGHHSIPSVLGHTSSETPWKSTREANWVSGRRGTRIAEKCAPNAIGNVL